MSSFKSSTDLSVINEVITKLLPDIKRTIYFSFFTNLLLLAPTWYMLEVYDRVINSHNHRTLLMLTLMVVILYCILEVLEWVRSRMMYEAAAKFDRMLNERVFNSIFQAKLKHKSSGTTQSLVDLKTIQEVIASPVLLAVIDMPFSIIILILVFLINISMGWFALGGAVLLSVITWVNQKRIQPHLNLANRHAIAAQNYVSSTIRNAQVIQAMGMLSRIHAKWSAKQHDFLRMQARASDLAGINSAVTKLVQVLQSSLLLGLGCWLTLNGDLAIGGSMMIIGSVLGGQMLRPLVLIVAQWRTIANAKDAVDRLDHFLNAFPESMPSMALPPPKGHLLVDAAVVTPPNSQIAILKGISFHLLAGSSLAIVGPSASGKTTLARLITGIWPAVNGKVRLDGADIFAWKKSELGPYVGYLPQDVEIFDGTIAENIARFGQVDLDQVKTAARIVGLDAFIESLTHGYHTSVGDDGSFLSGGQRQRVAIARAIYGSPRFVVLDEPNSSLDEEGDKALSNALRTLKIQGTTVVVITHRSQILSMLDYLMILTDGQIKALGPRDEVIKAMNKSNQTAPAVDIVGAVA